MARSDLGRGSVTRRAAVAAALGAVTAGLLPGCGGSPVLFAKPLPTSPLTETEADWVGAILARMTDQDLCSQVVMCPVCRIAGRVATKVDGEPLERGMREMPVGGVELNVGNISSRDQLLALIDDVRVLSTAVGASANAFVAMGPDAVAAARRVSSKPAEGSNESDDLPAFLRDLGVNLYLGPSLRPIHDAEANLQESSAEAVARLAQEVGDLAGLCRDYGVVDCPGHFPGIFSSAPRISAAHADELLRPYRNEEEPSVVMVRMCEADVVQDDGSVLPATLSPQWIGALRDEFGFVGAVLSAPIEDAARHMGLSPEEGALAFFKAGGDMVYCQENPKPVVKGLMAALESGALERSELERAARRVVSVKVGRGVQQF